MDSKSESGRGNATPWSTMGDLGAPDAGEQGGASPERPRKAATGGLSDAGQLTPRVLVVDDDEDFCEQLSSTLDALGARATACVSPQDALELVRSALFDAVFADHRMEEMMGPALCRQVHEVDPGLPVVMVTGFGDMETAVDALRSGAYDFLTKPVDRTVLGSVLARAVRQRRLTNELNAVRENDPREDYGIVGESPGVRAILRTIDRVAPTEASVLVCGESGTGKELVAAAVHARSGRASGPFVPVNCAAIPASLIESELFGHGRGAFTDAAAARSGLFVQAQGGTLFLDEVGELPPEVQPKLLRALQERRVRPVGKDHEVPFDARIVAATNRDLEADVDAGRFRADLFFRINVVRIDVPPLRERGLDVLTLAQRFLRDAAAVHERDVVGLGADAADALMAYDWPGNIRELQNAMDRAVALARFDTVTLADLPSSVREHETESPANAEDGSDGAEHGLVSLQEMEARYIRRVLRAVGGNKSSAARILGLDRRTLYRRLRRLESS